MTENTTAIKKEQTKSETTTAIIKSYSLALSFDNGPCSFLDPNTTINIAVTGDGNGNWKGSLSCAYPDTNHFTDEPISTGRTVPVGKIGTVSYSLQFTNEPGKRIFEAIRVTITGIDDSE